MPPSLPSCPHVGVLSVSPSLRVMIFHREGQLSDGSAVAGPFFVVREWDAKVIRGKKQDRPRSAATEQALRASVRQAILNMNLHLEKATRDEIQYLKHVGVLGKRAPSCSLLNSRDVLKLLYCFDKKRHAEELKRALGDGSAAAVSEDSAQLMTRVAAKNVPKPIALRAHPKVAIDPAAYPLRHVELELPKSVASQLVRRVQREAAGLPGDSELEVGVVKHKLPPQARKRKAANPVPQHAHFAAAAATAPPANIPQNPLEVIAGLDTLLSALRDIPEAPTEGQPNANASAETGATESVHVSLEPIEFESVQKKARLEEPSSSLNVALHTLPTVSSSPDPLGSPPPLPVAAAPSALSSAQLSQTSLPAADGLFSPTTAAHLYETQTLSLKDSPSDDLNGARSSIPSSLLLPSSFSPLAPSPSPSPSPSGAMYHHLLASPTPSPTGSQSASSSSSAAGAGDMSGDLFRWMGKEPMHMQTQ